MKFKEKPKVWCKHILWINGFGWSSPINWQIAHQSIPRSWKGCPLCLTPKPPRLSKKEYIDTRCEIHDLNMGDGKCSCNQSHRKTFEHSLGKPHKPK